MSLIRVISGIYYSGPINPARSMPAKKPAVTARRRKSQDNRGAVLFRASPEFKTWLERLATYDARPLNSTIEVSLIAHARAIGFTEAPPRRTRPRFGRPDNPPRPSTEG